MPLAEGERDADPLRLLLRRGMGLTDTEALPLAPGDSVGERVGLCDCLDDALPLGQCDAMRESRGLTVELVLVLLLRLEEGEGRGEREAVGLREGVTLALLQRVGG